MLPCWMGPPALIFLRVKEHNDSLTTAAFEGRHMPQYFLYLVWDAFGSRGFSSSLASGFMTLGLIHVIVKVFAWIECVHDVRLYNLVQDFWPHL